MRLLHIAMGSPEIDRAALDLGHEVRRIAWRELLGRKPHRQDAERLQGGILKDAREFRPDLVFIQTHQSEVVHEQTLYQLRQAGAFVVFWVGDVREPLPEYYLRIAPHVDVIAFSNLTDVELVRKAGHRAEYLQIGYDPDIYHPGDGTQKRSGIVFLGNHYHNQFPNSQLRYNVAERLRNEFGDQFTVRGGNWPWPDTRPTLPEEEAELYRRSLVAINVDHFTRPYFASDRILRAQACGCVVFSVPWDDGVLKEHPGVRMCTDNGAGLDEMVASLRGAIGLDGYCAKYYPKYGGGAAKHTFDNHRWHNRIKTMEGWMR